MMTKCVLISDLDLYSLSLHAFTSHIASWMGPSDHEGYPSPQVQKTPCQSIRVKSVFMSCLDLHWLRLHAFIECMASWKGTNDHEGLAQSTHTSLLLRETKTINVRC